MNNGVTEYELMLKKETKGAYIFIIPASGNDVMLPKSTCAIFVDSEDERLIEEKIYTVEVQNWIAEKKKIDDGGEEPIIEKIKCILKDERENAIRVKNDRFDLWFPKSTILNKDLPQKGQEFIFEIPEWLLTKKIKEASDESPTGKRVKSKPKTCEGNSQQEPPPKGCDNFTDEDIPF